MAEDELGTVRWFGPSWDAPVNDPRAHVDTPDQLCARCRRSFSTMSQGLTVPMASQNARLAYHLDCWMRLIGYEVTREVLQEERSLRDDDPGI